MNLKRDLSEYGKPVSKMFTWPEPALAQEPMSYSQSNIDLSNTTMGQKKSKYTPRILLLVLGILLVACTSRESFVFKQNEKVVFQFLVTYLP